MQLLYHNHAFEMERIEGKLAIDWMMEARVCRQRRFQDGSGLGRAQWRQRGKTA